LRETLEGRREEARGGEKQRSTARKIETGFEKSTASCNEGKRGSCKIRLTHRRDVKAKTQSNVRLTHRRDVETEIETALIQDRRRTEETSVQRSGRQRKSGLNFSATTEEDRRLSGLGERGERLNHLPTDLLARGDDNRRTGEQETDQSSDSESDEIRGQRQLRSDLLARG